MWYSGREKQPHLVGLLFQILPEEGHKPQFTQILHLVFCTGANRLPVNAYCQERCQAQYRAVVCTVEAGKGCTKSCLAGTHTGAWPESVQKAERSALQSCVWLRAGSETMEIAIWLTGSELRLLNFVTVSKKLLDRKNSFHPVLSRVLIGATLLKAFSPSQTDSRLWVRERGMILCYLSPPLWWT